MKIFLTWIFIYKYITYINDFILKNGGFDENRCLASVKTVDVYNTLILIANK